MKEFDDKLDKVLKDAELDDILDSIKNENVKKAQNVSYIDEIEPAKKSEPCEDKTEKALTKKKKPPIKAIVIICVAVLAVIGIVFGVIQYTSTAYLKPYKEKYGIDFPKGIAEDFCDAYGENQRVVGKLEIPDSNAELFVSSEKDSLSPHFENGSRANETPQFRSITIYSKNADIESAYSTAEKYNNAKQEVTFTDIYGNSVKYQVVCAYYVNTNPNDDNGYAFPYNLCGTLTEDSFDDFEDRVLTRSLFDAVSNLSYTSQYLTISADSDFMEQFRFVILCERVDGKIAPITDAVPNEKVHYPQIWYDENNEHNPYWLSSKWQPTYE